MKIFEAKPGSFTSIFSSQTIHYWSNTKTSVRRIKTPKVSIIKCNKTIVKIILGLLCIFSAPAWGAIEFTEAYNFRDFRVNPPPTYNPGPDLLIFGIYITDSDTGAAPEGAIVRAKNLVSSVRFGEHQSTRWGLGS